MQQFVWKSESRNPKQIQIPNFKSFKLRSPSSYAPLKSPREIHIFNSMGEKQQTVTGIAGAVDSLAFSAEGRLLSADLSGASAMVWEVTP